MFWDIALPVLAAFAQGLTGFLGWRVTVDGVQEERKKLYEWLFALASLIGIVSVGIAAYRGTQLSHDLADLKKGQQVTNAGIEHIESTTPPTVNVYPQINMPGVPPPKEHTHVTYASPPTAYMLLRSPDLSVSLLSGRVPAVPFLFNNSGDFPVLHPSDAALVVFAPINKTYTVFKDNRNALQFNAPGGDIPVHSQESDYHTALGPVLSDDNIKQIWAGNLCICGVGAVRWSDKTGKYETHFAHCLAAEPDHRALSWHDTEGNNKEVPR